MHVELVENDFYSPPAELGPYRAADYWQLGEQPCELIYGRIYMSPSPRLWHQQIVLFLAEWLAGIARRTGGIGSTAPMDVMLADHSILQPDLLYIAPANKAIAVDRIEGPPDLVIEVLSPGTARRDRVEKLQLYAEHGVKEYWLVDAAAKQIDFLVNRDGKFEVVLAVNEVYQSQVTPEIQLDVRRFWSNLSSRLPS